MKVTFRAKGSQEQLKVLEENASLYGIEKVRKTKKQSLLFTKEIKQFRDYKGLEIFILEELHLKLDVVTGAEWIAVVALNSNFGEIELEYEEE